MGAIGRQQHVEWDQAYCNTICTGKKKSRDARLHGSSKYGFAIKRSGIADLFSFY